MSEVLTVPTAFGDISDMAQGLVDRVDEQQIILYGPSAYEEGAELDFALLLLDGTPALEGRGIVAASVDGGEERDPSTRYDIILQGLQFDGAAEVVFERMVMARFAGNDASQEIADLPASDEPESIEAEPEPEVEADSVPRGFDEEATVVAQVDDAQVQAALEASAAAEPEPPPAEEPEAAWEPAPAAEPSPEPEAAWASEASPEPQGYIPPEELPTRIYSPDAPTQPPPDEAAEDALAASAADEPEPSPEPARTYSQPPTSSYSEPPRAYTQSPPRTFSQPPRDPDALRSIAHELEVRPGAPPPEPPPPPSGFAIDNSLAGGLVRPHTVWSPVAPPPPEPRPSSGLFQYGRGPIPIPERPPRPDLDPSLRVQRAPAPIREGEPVPAFDGAEAPRRARRAELDDAFLADAVDLDPITADD